MSSFNDKVLQLEQELKETRNLLELITSKITYFHYFGVIDLDQEENNNYKQELEKFENIPKDLSNCFVDYKSCLYRYEENNNSEDINLKSNFIGYIDTKIKKFYPYIKAN